MNKFKTLFFCFVTCVVIYSCPAARADSADQIAGTATWWECNSFEIQLSGTAILIDPYFPFYRKANVILITHHHEDHCHVDTITRIIEASGDALDLIVGSKSCENSFTCFEIKEERLADRGEVLTYAGLTIETVPSYEDVDDIGFIIRDSETGLSLLHMGDNTRYIDDFKEIQDIDYLFLAMGKMSLEDTILFLKAVKPKYLIPMHYKPARGAFLPKHYSYPSPEDPDQYLSQLVRMIKDSGIETRMIVLNPGQTQDLISAKGE
jgi:L-ascorbate metabolism protein UlaG (beta-lactamase superfamily)